MLQFGMRYLTIALMICSLCCPASSDDNIAERLNKAKKAHVAAVKSAQEVVLNEFTKAEAKLRKSSKPTAEKVEGVKQLTEEKEEFAKSWTRPKSPLMATAMRKFNDEMKDARKDLEAAFDKAAADYDKQKDLESASRVLDEKFAFQVRMSVLDDSRWVTFAGAGSGKVLEVWQGSINHGIGLQQSTPARGADKSLNPEQVWQLIPVEEEWFAIKNRKSGLFICVRDGSNADGAEIMQWEQKDGDDGFEQHWKFVPVRDRGSNAVQIVNRKTNKLLSLEKESDSEGVKIRQLGPLENAKSQQWILSPAK